MITFRLIPASLVSCLFLVCSVASADPVIRSCAQHAAHPNDSGNLGYGVAFSKINGDAAKQACLQAYQKFPSDGLVNTALSRAYNKLEQYDASFKHASIAVQNEYPFAYYIMGTLYSYGDGVPKSESEANKWYFKAGNKGVAVGSSALGANLLNGNGIQKDLTLARQWIDKSIAQGNKSAEHTKWLIIEAQAEQQKEQTGDIAAYLSALSDAHQLITQTANETGLNGSTALARINKKIEQQQPPWATIIPDIPDSQRNSKEEGYPWKTLPKIVTNNGKEFQASYVSIGGTVLALWHEFDEANNASQWYIDFDYRGSTPIDSLVELSVRYKGEIIGDRPSKTSEQIAFTEMSTQDTNTGRRAVGKVDYRAVELLRGGTDIVAYYWSTDARSKNFTLPLNLSEYKSDSQSVIGVLTSNVEKRSDACCKRSAIAPFTWRYWSQRRSCEGIRYVSKDTLAMNFFGRDYVNKTDEDLDAKKSEFLADCDEVRLPITFNQ